MSVKDIIFVVLAACLMCYLHRRDMLGRAAAELGTVVPRSLMDGEAGCMAGFDGGDVETDGVCRRTAAGGTGNRGAGWCIFTVYCAGGGVLL